MSRKWARCFYFTLLHDTLHTNTDIHSTLDDFNSIHPNLISAERKEQCNLLNYLDNHSQESSKHTDFDLQKTYFTDTLIPYRSNHPTQHKYSALRFLYDRVNSHVDEEEEHQGEENIIQNILHNNFFPLTFHKRYTPKQLLSHQPKGNKHEWNTIAYFWKETTYITNLFKHSNLQIAFRTNNTLQHHLIHNTHNPEKFTRSGVYKLTCADCKKAYIGQTGRDFINRYNEHKRSYWNNTHTSKFAHHLNENINSFSSIHNVMQILQFQKKGPHLNTIERFQIHKEALPKITSIMNTHLPLIESLMSFWTKPPPPIHFTSFTLPLFQSIALIQIFD